MTQKIIELAANGLTRDEIVRILGVRRLRVKAVLDPIREDQIIALHKKGLTQTAIAKELGISMTSVNKILSPFKWDLRQIRELYMRGYTKEEIAEKLGFTVEEVDARIPARERRVLEKWGAGISAACIAHELGVSRQAIYNTLGKYMCLRGA